MSMFAEPRTIESVSDDPLQEISIDYPIDASIFPPEFPAPTFLWRDPEPNVKQWLIEVTFADGSPSIRETSNGPPMEIGEIDPRCVSSTNELPRLNRQQAESKTWTPAPETWETIKKHSREAATVTITGYLDAELTQAASRGQSTLETSTDPVGAPIFYRDVPLMPSPSTNGIIQPLATSALPLIAWRLKYVDEPGSHVLMEDLHTCANCHSFSLDGKTMGLDVDGPQNDKGLYALVPVHEQTSITNDNVIEWSDFRGKLGGRFRTAFMAQVSPDGRHVVATINDPGKENRERMEDVRGKYFVTNFLDYRFLQVFYPTRGVLGWYSHEKGYLTPLPGADDPQYVHTGATWSPDGKFLVFARAEARDPFPPDNPLPAYANDPNELQIQYSLYRIPFNDGKGGVAEPIKGASHNGMSNNFAKISPDGRWIVFVKCRNGQLMRPDSELYIVPIEGGVARKMTCNTPLMNSWHSFSPNGRWMVFSSKGRSPYTQMYLTHIDSDGRDSPAILVENT
ncbi:MAG: PD40 domain-containing protein, partial [Acidobacteriota bacterium]